MPNEFAYENDAPLCSECNLHHGVFLTCYSAYKHKREQETGCEFWPDVNGHEVALNNG